jgi:predicted lipid-binding transport protein (Tim44 family)
MAMGEFQQYFDIILFAMVAGFLVLRLRSVLGRRTGNERRRDLFPRRSAPASSDNVATLVEPDKRAARPADDGPSADAIAEGLSRVRRADPGFDPSHFIEGARTAFEMIVAAFARGDKAVLRPLLSDEVFQQFAAAIDERVAAEETLETRIVKLEAVDVGEAQLVGPTAQLTLKLVSHQINVTRAWTEHRRRRS